MKLIASEVFKEFIYVFSINIPVTNEIALAWLWLWICTGIEVLTSTEIS